MALTHEERRAILERCGLADVISEPLAMPADLGPEVVISPDDQEWSPYFVTVRVRDIEHLKQLTGIPSDVAASAIASGSYQVPDPGGSHVTHRARTALFGDWTGSLANEESAREVEEFMMRAAAELPVFATTDLVIHDGETYTLRGAPTFYFDSITVYGTGEIVTEGQIKIFSDVIAHILV
jgi:hypothetical protein